MTKVKKPLKTAVLICLCLAALGLFTVLGLNIYITASTADQILPPDSTSLQDYDCILVLGCGVWADGTPSHMLEDRLKRSVELYNAGASGKLLMSGDHGRADYNEVAAMKQYAMDAGIPSSDIFMDHAGFSTYESIYRAKEVFCAKKVLIISQAYHLPRALHIANSLGLEAQGVSADYRSYSGQIMREIREVLARCKDFVMGIFKPEPTYLGEAIPVFGNGDVTNDT